jgi:RecA/RadA recombinase
MSNVKEPKEPKAPKEPKEDKSGAVLDELRKSLKGIIPDGETILKSTYSKITSYTHTGNYHLNAMLSGSLFGGYPNNKTIQLAGESGVGKSYLALNACREFQKAGYYIQYFDSEGAIDLNTVINFGIDPEKFDLQPVSEFNQFRTAAITLATTMLEAQAKNKPTPKIMVVLDSLGMLPTAKELNDAITGNDARDFTKPQVVRSLFRLITSKFTGAGIPFIYTNHTYGGPSQVPVVSYSGGQGQVYSPSAILNLSKAKLKDSKEDEKKQTGIVVTAKAEKNRMAVPNAIKFHIHFAKGMNPYIGMETYISWETCGIEKGILYDEKEFAKLKPEEKSKCKPFEHNGEQLYFYAKETAKNYIVKHLGAGVTILDLFTDKVFTRDVLEQIETKCIVSKFKFGVDDETPEIEEFLSEE